MLIGSVQISRGDWAAACHRRAVGGWRWTYLKKGRRLKGSCPGEQRHTQKNEEEEEEKKEEEKARAAGLQETERMGTLSGRTVVAEQPMENSLWAVRYQRCSSSVRKVNVCCTKKFTIMKPQTKKNRLEIPFCLINNENLPTFIKHFYN